MREAVELMGGGAFAMSLVLLLVAVVAHEPWRWIGLLLGHGVSADDEVFLWVRLVSTALVAGLVVRVVVFPAGALEEVALSARLVALGAGVFMLLASGRNLAVGILASAGVLAMLAFVGGSG